ncbi:unnamed protein product [Caenorhabditis nigoni]
MKKLIISSQNNRFKNIKSISYTCEDTNRQPVIDISCKPNWREDLIEINEREKDDNDYFQLNVSGKLIDFRLFKGYANYLVAYFNPDDSPSVIESIHNYVLHFFGDSAEYLWRTSDCENIIPRLQNITACIRLWDAVSEPANLGNFFSASPDLKWINIHDRVFEELSRSDSKIYQAETIETIQTYSDSLPILRYFQGKQAFVNCVECYTKDLMEFVLRWKTGKAFRKLELMELKFNIDRIPRNELLNVIGAKHIDVTKTPPTHTVPKIDEWFNENRNTDPIISHRYVVRKTDNHVASVLIQETTFSFRVWDMTEEEFLRMME